MSRDGFACQGCKSSSKTLNVHHALYRKGFQPWGYELSELITLCEDCHRLAEIRRNLILESTANPRVQLAVMHFAEVLAGKAVPYPAFFQLILENVHTLMIESEDALLGEGDGDDNDPLRNFRETMFETLEWLFRLTEYMRKQVNKQSKP